MPISVRHILESIRSILLRCAASDLGKPGTVVEVRSGDTIVVMGDDTQGKPPMKQLNLSSLQAPRLSNHRESDDEAFAWPSREFLRRLLIGKKIHFKIDYSRGRDASNQREYAAVYIGDRSVAAIVAEHGWARVDDEGQTRFGKADNYEELVRLNTQANADSRGIYQGADLSSVRDVRWGVTNPKSFLNKVKGEPQRAVVQKVRDGASMTCLLIPSFDMVTFYLAGVQCPRVNSGGKPSGAAAGGSSGPAPASKPEAFAMEARHNTMKRMLNRDVVLHFGAVDSYGNFMGRVEYPEGNISEVLLGMGLARMVDRSLDAVEPKYIHSMRAAENRAKSDRLRLWKGWAPATVSGESAFEGTVSEVPSGDTVVVTVEKGTPSAPEVEHRRVTLASIRAPRMGRRGGEGMEPYAMQARELLRVALIGQQVLVTVDYVREPAEGAKGLAARERRCATVVLKAAPRSKAEPAIDLVSNGFCTVVRHRAEESRASSYDALIIAEQEAKKAGLGVHGTGAGPVYTVTDVSARASLMRDELPFLQRERSMAAVVEYVMAGGRFKVRVPDRKCEMVLALAGVRCPRTPRGATRGSDGGDIAAREGEPFGEAAAEYCKALVLHRDVTISVEEADQRGTALGVLKFDLNGREVNIGTDLLSRGLGRFMARGAPAAHASEFEAAQESARSKRRGLWEDEEEEAEAEEETRTTETVTRMTVSEVADGTTLMMQADGDRARLDRVQDYMQQMLEKNGTQGAPVETKKNSIVAALFTDEDGDVAWYRARIEGTLSPEEAGAAASGAGGEKLFKVLFIDYGNVDAVPASMMRPVGSSTIAAIPALARVCTLAFLRSKPIEDERLGEAARAALAHLTLNESFRCRIHGRDASNRMRVTLLPDSDEEGGEGYLGVELMSAGFHRVSFLEARDAQRRIAEEESDPIALADWQYVEKLREAEAEAKKAGENLWEFGDVADSDDEGR